MSQPENPLAQYYTYAYHHILMACDTTEVAEALQNANEFVTFLRTPEPQYTYPLDYLEYSVVQECAEM